MTLKLSNIMIALLLFASVTVLYSEVYTFFTGEYGVTPEDTIDGMTIMQKFENMNIVLGVESAVTGLFKIVNPASSFDIVGGFLSVSIGVIKIATGLISLPIEIIGIVTGFYYVPPIVAQIIGLIFMVLVGMILLNISSGGNN